MVEVIKRNPYAPGNRVRRQNTVARPGLSACKHDSGID
jgi:hypothetical protein